MENNAREVDAELVLAIREGDPSAYRGLVERYQGRVYSLICGMVRDREEARDLTQDAFIKAYKNLHRFRLESSFYTWLYRIAMNVAIDHLRKMKKRKHEAFDENVAARDSDGLLSAAHDRTNPGKALDRKELHDQIYDALDLLSPDHRQVVLLREVEGLTYQEISDTMGIPEGTVMSRLFYARRKLRDALKDHLPASEAS
jgi:RNA polymerase sigma-70 factor (ECF subfamily)